jgi:hypothetical protein
MTDIAKRRAAPDLTDNLRHWSALERTDPKHTKQFQRAGGFRGTATKPIWTEYRLTQHFGPCGIGWGCDEPVFSTIPAGEEILVFCTLRCWYKEGEGKQATLYGVGGDKLYFKDKNGLHADDEAYKKAFTDALGNAFKHVGSGADVHMGLFDDSKYVSEMRKEFADEAPQKPAGEPIPSDPPAPLPNGKSAPQPLRTDTPDRKAMHNRAVAARDRIRTALGVATTPALIEQIIETNDADLRFLKTFHAPSFEALLQLAASLKTDMYAATG